MTKIKPSVVDSIESLDRGGGASVEVSFTRGGSRRVSLSDEQIDKLIGALIHVRVAEDRPLSERVVVGDA